MTNRFFGEYYADTQRALTDIRRRFGVKAFLTARRMLVAAWYASTKPDTDYIDYSIVIKRTLRVLEKQEITFHDVMAVNYCTDQYIDVAFFGVQKKTILYGNMTQTLVEALDYYYKRIEE